MKRIPIISFVIILFGGMAIYFHETKLSGDDFRKVVLSHRGNSYASWELYRIGDNEYCMKLAKPPIPRRFCVPRKDLEIHNGAGEKAQIGVIYKGDWKLRFDRTDGARDEWF